MKFLFLRTIPVLVLCGFCFRRVPANVSAQQPEAPLTNAAVVKLVRAGFKEKTVIAIIRSRPNRFELDPDRLIELKRNGVSENIILTMLALDESFFRQTTTGATIRFSRARAKPARMVDATQEWRVPASSDRVADRKARHSGRGMNGCQ